MSNARDTTNFTTKYLQTDMASYMDIIHQQLILNVNIESVNFQIPILYNSYIDLVISDVKVVTWTITNEALIAYII